MDRANQTSRKIDAAQAYCIAACVLGVILSFCLMSEVYKFGVDVPGMLYVLWAVVSVVAAALAFWKKRYMFAISPTAFVLYEVVNYLSTPDNLFTRTLDTATIVGIIFGASYAALNGWLLSVLRR